MRFPSWLLGPFIAVHPALAQTGSFVARLGTDTMQIEHFTIGRERLEGLVVTRVPSTRFTRWSAALDGEGRIIRYESSTLTATGDPVSGAAERVVMTWQGDSLIRDVTMQGARSEQRLRVPGGTVPGPSLPYLGTSYLLWELGFRQALRTTPDSTGARVVPTLSAVTRQMAPGATRFWAVRPDSIEADYFGMAKTGWAFDGAGSLLRTDWRRTTYRYHVERGPAIDAERVGRAWATADAAGQGGGPMSPRDTVRGSVDGVAVTIEYSRPARRGRTIWGQVVPWGEIWRLGADMATQISFSADVVVGDRAVPAGSYSLWLLPHEGGTSQLVVNRQAKIWGTQHNPRDDLVRVPLARKALPASIERLTLAVEDGRLVIRWGDLEWSVAVGMVRGEG